MAEENEFSSGSTTLVVNQAIRSRLEALKNTRIFARTPQEAASLGVTYRMIREGGVLVIDIAGLSNLAREGFVQAIIELVKDLCLWEIEHDTHRFPFIFFEEAHLYVSRRSIDYIVTRARHLGITSFFVTNMIHGFELQGKPKTAALEARVGRILSVGTDSHRRLQRGLARACLAQ
jgi:hypothetical protein